jgi:hypothetical protein
LDCLLQVGGGLASINRRALVPADYSDFINDALPLLNGHRGLMAPPTWSGGPGHWKGTSPPSYSAHSTFLRIQFSQAGPGIGRTRVPQATRLSPPFYVSNLVRRARALEGYEPCKPRLSPPFCASNLVRWAQALEGHESCKLPCSAHLSTHPIWSGGPSIGRTRFLQATRLSPPFCASNLVERARASDGHGVLQATRLRPPFWAINPDNLLGLELFQEGKTLDSLTITPPSRGHSATCQRLL